MMRILANEPGWIGAFTRAQAPCAQFRNGSRVAKQGTDETDAHKDGALATVLGSIESPAGIVYFVEWDDRPRIACAIVEPRLKEAR